MKKNHMTRILALALALILVLCTFTGCGKNSREQIVGKWATDIDFGSVMEKALAEEEQAAELFGDADFSGISLPLTMEFKEDGTYEVNVDKASGEKAVKQMADVMIPSIKELMRKELASTSGSEVSDEELDSMLAMMGMESWEDFGDMVLSQIDTDQMFDDINATGKYMLKNDKLYTSGAVDEEATEESDAFLCEINGDTLKLSSQQDKADLPDFLKELTLTRVG